MTLSAIEATRLKTSDRPTIIREEWLANGDTKDIKLNFDRILSVPAVRVWRDSVQLTETVDYTIDYVYGVLKLILVPAVNVPFEFEYYAVVFDDDEVDYFLGEAGGNVTLAAALMLMAWAASDAKLARRETLSGGGGIGSATVDTSVRVREMRASAKAYMDQYQEFEGTGVPVEYITEVGWTNQTASRLITREIIVNGE